MSDTGRQGGASPPWRHCPYYCEENIFWLARDLMREADDVHVVFISNPARSVAVWRQRLCPAEAEPIVWDYHVIAVARPRGPSSSSWRVWDLDTTLPIPAELHDYLDASFMGASDLRTRFQPWFRLVPAPVYCREFHSDRSHMRDGERWLRTPPSWAPIFGELSSEAAGPDDCIAARAKRAEPNLARFIDVEQQFLGEVHDLVGLRYRLQV